MRCSLVSKRAKVCKGAFTSAFKAKGRQNSLGKCSKFFLRLKHGLDFILECLLFVKIVDFWRFLAQILPECNAPDLVSPSILPSSGRTAEARKRGKNGERREIRDVASAILHLRSRSQRLVANYCKLHLKSGKKPGRKLRLLLKAASSTASGTPQVKLKDRRTGKCIKRWTKCNGWREQRAKCMTIFKKSRIFKSKGNQFLNRLKLEGNQSLKQICHVSTSFG